MSKKTIDINPDLFNIGKTSKTKKNREKKIMVAPIISPNILKNKLLKRIKEHKNKETSLMGKKEESHSNLTTPQTNLKPSLVIDDDEDNIDVDKYTDEFKDSLTYLESLTTQKKLNDEKAIYEKNRQKKMEELQRRTLKNHSHANYSANSSMPMVSLDLPDSLREMTPTNLVTPQEKKDDSPPWGVLKGGAKPTYRLWNKTQRNVQNASYTGALSINNIKPAINVELGEREKKMAALKEKVRQKQSQTIPTIIVPPLQKSQPVVQVQTEIPKIHEFVLPVQDGLSRETVINQNDINQNAINQNAINQNTNIVQDVVKPVAFKRILKKTIRRKYTLGKSKIKRTVAVLLKDQKTKKKILTAYRDLKREPINNVKKKLRERNLIKIGSSAPNDVVRQIYESAMLSGEISNTNSDILLHNLTKDV